MTTSSSNIRLNRARMAQGAVGLLVGGGLGFLIGRILKSSAVDFTGLTWSDHVAGLIAAMLFASGLILTAATFSKRLAARVMDPTSDRPARPAQIVFYRQQAIVLALSGLMLVAPVAARLVSQPLSSELAGAVMAAIIALFLLQTFLNLSVWTRADEMVRQMVAESGAVCFWVLQGALFLWAAAEKLELVPALTTWDTMTVLMGFYLATSAVISVRRGFA
jgi:uncharacterized protein YacL